jgi:Na+/H+ antiporter NhaD/arsenite permease-like protein
MGPTAVVFVITYALVARRRVRALPLGRPAVALLGATAMVGLSAIHSGWGIGPAAAFAAVEPNTIGLLLGMMLLSAALAEAGFFARAAAWVVERRLSPVALLYAVTFGAGILSALLVNDPVCLLLAPVVDRTARRAGLDRVPYLLALAMGSNAGSAMTLAGNPQNMLVANLSGLSYRAYLVRGGPAALLALLATAAILHALLRARLHAASTDPVVESARPDPHPREVTLMLACVAGVAALFLAGANLAWSAIAGAAVAMVLRRRDPAPLWSRVSWTVLVFFAALFVVTAALQRSLPADFVERAARFAPSSRAGMLATLSGALLVGCQIVSNVPFILLGEPWIRTLPDQTLAWTTTAVVSTLVGNLTLLGSVANIIVIETANAQREIGFRSYLKVGVPVTIGSTLVAVVWLWATAGWYAVR